MIGNDALSQIVSCPVTNQNPLVLDGLAAAIPALQTVTAIAVAMPVCAHHVTSLTLPATRPHGATSGTQSCRAAGSTFILANFSNAQGAVKTSRFTSTMPSRSRRASPSRPAASAASAASVSASTVCTAGVSRKFD